MDGRDRPNSPNDATSNRTNANQGTSNQTTPKQGTPNPTTPNQGTSNQLTSRDATVDSDYHLNEDTDLDADIVEDVLFYVSGTEGKMGLYQKILFFLMMPFAVFFAWVYFVQFFITVAPEKYWCKIPELASLSMEQRRSLSAPGAASGTWDSCNTFDTNWANVLQTMRPPSPQTPKVPCQHGWEFEMTEIHYHTVITERGWVCNNARNVPTVHAMFFAGALVGGVVVGWIADNMGRIPAIMVSNLVGGIGGIATTHTTGLWDFCVCRFLAGLAFDSCFLIPYILTLEFVGPAHRTCVATMPQAIFYGLAAVILPWIAYFVADWRILMYITHLPMFIVIIAPWVMPESIRWLVSCGRIDAAIKVLRRIEWVNKSHIPEDVMQKFIASTEKKKSQKIVSFLTMFKRPLLRMTAILMVLVYCGGSCLYDCIVRLTQTFGMNFFVAFTLNTAIEIPSLLVLTVLLDRLGRRNLTAGSMFLAFLFVLFAMFVPKGGWRVTFGLAARFLFNMAFILMFQWSSELLPTAFRASGSTALHIAGFAISLLSPFIVYLDKYSAALPLIIVAGWSLITGCISMLMPETKGYEMPQTVADAEKIILNETLWRKRDISVTGTSITKILSKTIQEPLTRNPAGRMSQLVLESRSRMQ